MGYWSRRLDSDVGAFCGERYTVPASKGEGSPGGEEASMRCSSRTEEGEGEVFDDVPCSRIRILDVQSNCLDLFKTSSTPKQRLQNIVRKKTTIRSRKTQYPGINAHRRFSSISEPPWEKDPTREENEMGME